MTEFEKVLLAHLQRYPLMGPEDCAKLIYQSEFAGEHMIADAGQCLEWIRRELDETEPRNGEIYEDIGSEVFRLHLGPAKAAGMDAREINERFISSAARASGTKVGQEQKLMLLEELCREGDTPFSMEMLMDFLEKYRAEGCPALHHSVGYREAYQPHYRVVKL